MKLIDRILEDIRQVYHASVSVTHGPTGERTITVEDGALDNCLQIIQDHLQCAQEMINDFVKMYTELAEMGFEVSIKKGKYSIIAPQEIVELMEGHEDIPELKDMH